MFGRCPDARTVVWCLSLCVIGTSLILAADPPQILFDFPLTVLSGDTRDLASADFNGDGRKDLAVIVQNSSGVRMLLGQGNGTFFPAPTALVSVLPSRVEAADFNRDGHQDLVVSDDVARAVLVAFGSGDGTFTAGPAYATGLAPFFLAPANVNGDAWPDLIVGGPHFGIAVFLNLGHGAMGPRIDVWPDGGAPPFGGRVAYHTADVDADGRDDIVVAGYEQIDFECNGDGFVFYRNLGAGSFARTHFSGSICPYALAVADWNRDGRRDVLVLSFGGLQLYGNLGGGSFAAPSTLFSSAQGEELIVGDFNLDGFPDVVLPEGSDLFVRAGREDGTLMPDDEPFLLWGNYADVLVGDFDNGLADLVLSLHDFAGDPGQVQLFLNRSIPAPAPVGEASPGSAAPLQIAGYDPASGNITFTYAPACGAFTHNVVYGSLEPPNRGAYVGRACDVGSTGVASFNPGTESVFFLLVGQGPAIEGSYGQTSYGAERPEAVGLGVCDRPQVLASHCP